jgi:hypothetical protein
MTTEFEKWKQEVFPVVNFHDQNYRDLLLKASLDHTVIVQSPGPFGLFGRSRPAAPKVEADLENKHKPKP